MEKDLKCFSISNSAKWTLFFQMIDFDIEKIVSLPDLDNLHPYDYCNIRKNLGLADFMRVSAKAT